MKSNSKVNYRKGMVAVTVATILASYGVTTVGATVNENVVNAAESSMVEEGIVNEVVANETTEVVVEEEAVADDVVEETVATADEEAVVDEVAVQEETTALEEATVTQEAVVTQEVVQTPSARATNEVVYAGADFSVVKTDEGVYNAVVGGSSQRLLVSGYAYTDVLSVAKTGLGDYVVCGSAYNQIGGDKVGFVAKLNSSYGIGNTTIISEGTVSSMNILDNRHMTVSGPSVSAITIDIPGYLEDLREVGRTTVNGRDIRVVKDYGAENYSIVEVKDRITNVLATFKSGEEPQVTFNGSDMYFISDYAGDMFVSKYTLDGEIKQVNLGEVNGTNPEFVYYIEYIDGALFVADLVPSGEYTYDTYLMEFDSNLGYVASYKFASTPQYEVPTISTVNPTDTQLVVILNGAPVTVDRLIINNGNDDNVVTPPVEDNGSQGGDDGSTIPPTDNGDQDNNGTGDEVVVPPTDNDNQGGNDEVNPPVDNGDQDGDQDNNGGVVVPPTDNGNQGGEVVVPPTDNGDQDNNGSVDNDQDADDNQNGTVDNDQDGTVDNDQDDAVVDDNNGSVDNDATADDEQQGTTGNDSATTNPSDSVVVTPSDDNNTTTNDTTTGSATTNNESGSTATLPQTGSLPLGGFAGLASIFSGLGLFMKSKRK